MLKANPEDLEAKDRKIFVKGSPEKAVGFAEAVRAHLYDAQYTGHILLLVLKALKEKS